MDKSSNVSLTFIYRPKYMMKDMIKSSQQSGRSMIEMLGVLAIIGVLSVGGIAGYSQAMAKFKVTKATDQIQTAVTNIRTLYASARNYGTINNQVLYRAGAIGDEVCMGHDSCTNPLNTFGGKFSFAAASTGGMANKAFTVNYAGLPSEACVKLSSYDWGDASAGLIQVKVGTTVVCATANNTCPADVATTAQACGSISGGDHYIVYTFR